MTNISDNVAYTYIEYSSAFHMKYKQLFVDRVYDCERVDEYPLIISWAEADMRLEEDSGKCLVVATKTEYYPDTLKLSEDVFENMIQAFVIFPDTNEDDKDSNKLRLEFVRALLNS